MLAVSIEKRAFISLHCLERPSERSRFPNFWWAVCKDHSCVGWCTFLGSVLCKVLPGGVQPPSCDYGSEAGMRPGLIIFQY